MTTAIWCMSVFDAQDVFELAAEAAGGGHAAGLFRLLTQTITTIMTAGSRAECSICGGPLEGNPAGFAVVSPYDVDQMAQATGGGICMSCIEPAETLLDRATEAFRQIVPDLRVLATPSAPGHA